jgi:hypothetical protein
MVCGKVRVCNAFRRANLREKPTRGWHTGTRISSIDFVSRRISIEFFRPAGEYAANGLIFVAGKTASVPGDL